MSAAGKATASIIGFLLAPLTPGMLLVILSASVMKLPEGIWALKMSAIIGYPAAIALGLPAHLFLIGTGRTRLSTYVVAGLSIGLVLGGVILFSPISMNLGSMAKFSAASPALIAALCLAGFFGAISAAAYWVIARPDR